MRRCGDRFAAGCEDSSAIRMAHASTGVIHGCRAFLITPMYCGSNRAPRLSLSVRECSLLYQKQVGHALRIPFACPFVSSTIPALAS